MKKQLILSLAALLLCCGFASAQSSDPIQGTWAANLIGLGNSTWTFVPLGNGTYSAQESGLGAARGIASLIGNQLRIDFSTSGGTGNYIVYLNGNGMATGTVRITSGGIAGRSWTVNMSRIAGPANAPGMTWRESESSYIGTFYGTWTWDPNRRQFIARWNNNAQAVLTIVSDDGQTIVLRRFDPAGASNTMTAEYVGRRNGNTINGTVTWYYRGGKNTGTWSASW